MTFQHCRDILHAFRMDATKLRYDDWADLMHYCRYSASPVGRQLLDLHGESQDTWPPGDALCNALQVLNHLQDCAEDHRNLDRVYLPRQDLEACGATIPELQAGQLSPGMRCAIDRLLDGTDRLIAEARNLPPRVKSPGLRRECAVIVNLAERLSGHLRRGDPLATRVKLKPVDFASALLIGVWRGR
jgi:farnesyl-diphosphate farnesyltransferase